MNIMARTPRATRKMMKSSIITRRVKASTVIMVAKMDQTFVDLRETSL